MLGTTTFSRNFFSKLISSVKVHGKISSRVKNRLQLKTLRVTLMKWVRVCVCSFSLDVSCFVKLLITSDRTSFR